MCDYMLCCKILQPRLWCAGWQHRCLVKQGQMQIVICRLAAQVSQYYKDIEELDSIQQLRKYLGQVAFPSLNRKMTFLIA